LFDSDWPFIEEKYSYEQNIKPIEDLPILQSEKQYILYYNAKTLLKIQRFMYCLLFQLFWLINIQK